VVTEPGFDPDCDEAYGRLGSNYRWTTRWSKKQVLGKFASWGRTTWMQALSHTLISCLHSCGGLQTWSFGNSWSYSRISIIRNLEVCGQLLMVLVKIRGLTIHHTGGVSASCTWSFSGQPPRLYTMDLANQNHRGWKFMEFLLFTKSSFIF
jgi:hypothetical protein